MLNRTEITTDGSWLRSHFGVLDRVRYQELARRVQPAVPDQGERKYASQSLSLPNPGLAIVAARRAFTRDRPLPPGGVLLGIGLKYGDGWDCVDGTEYKCEVEEVLDRRGRLRMTIDVSMRSPGRTSSPALVGFTLLWPKETETYIADNQTKSLEPKVGIVKAPVGEQIASLTLERERIRAWAELSADDNPLHTDTAFAATTRFEVPIVHGHLLVCIAVEELMSRVAFTSVNATFHAPVPVGSHIAILWDPDAALARIIIPGAEGPAVELHVEGALVCRTRTHDTEQTVIRNGQGDEPNN